MASDLPGTDATEQLPVTVVVSRSRPGRQAFDSPSADGAPPTPGAPPRRRDREDAATPEDRLAATLADRGFPVVLVPHVYDLRPDGPAATCLRAIEGPRVFAAWLYPRATRWTLKALGVLSAEEPGGDASDVRCVDLREWPSVDDAAPALCSAAASVGPAPKGGAGSAQEVPGQLSPRWYPVLDYSRCATCRQCLDFCLFGVYVIEEGRVVARHPDACKPGCPACARICPRGAIIFPHCEEPLIAGGPEPQPDALPAGAGIASAPSAGHGRPGKSRAAPESSGDLDDLMDALEQLDE